MPGSVSVGVEQRQHAEDHSDVDRHCDVGEDAEQSVSGDHEHDHHSRADIRGDLALVDRILAEAGADDALLDRRQLRRQGAGAQQDRQIVGALHGEAAGNLPRAAEDRLTNDGRRDHLVVEHDGEGLADVFLRHLREFAGAAGIEAERHDRFAGALVKARLGVGQLVAGHQHALLDEIGRFGFAGAVENLRILGGAALLRLLRRHRGVDHAEFELGGLADDVEQPLRIAEPRHLHQNTVGALALDRRFDQAELVDALFDDRQSLVDGAADAFGDGDVGNRQPDQAVARIGHIDRALSGTAQNAAERRRQFAQLGERLVQIRSFADTDFDAVAADRKAGIAGARVAQHTADVVAQRIHALFAHVVDVDFEQNVRAALQIEAQHDVALRPDRPAFYGRFRQEIRKREHADDKCRQQNRRRFPPREIKHEVPT